MQKLLEHLGFEAKEGDLSVSFSTGLTRRDRFILLPMTMDEFSGKTVRDHEMAGELMRSRNPNAPQVGQFAPRFDLPDARGRGEIALEDYVGVTPVALVFGSYT